MTEMRIQPGKSLFAGSSGRRASPVKWRCDSGGRGARNANAARSAATVVLAGLVAAAATVLLAAVVLAATLRQAEATPVFAQQSKMPCGGCHLNPAGGGKRNSFGERFKAKGNKL